MNTCNRKFHPLCNIRGMISDPLQIFCHHDQIKDPVYVGDIEGDYEASKEAGVKFIHAAYGFGTIRDEVPEIHALKELPAVADKVTA